MPKGKSKGLQPPREKKRKSRDHDSRSSSGGGGGDAKTPQHQRDGRSGAGVAATSSGGKRRPLPLFLVVLLSSSKGSSAKGKLSGETMKMKFMQRAAAKAARVAEDDPLAAAALGSTTPAALPWRRSRRRTGCQQ